MCGPMAIIGLVSAGISAAGTMAQANAQAAGLKSQAEWQKRQANVEEMKTAYAINQQRRKNKAALGSQTLYYAGAGIVTGSGTPTDVAMATVEANEMDIQARRMQGSEEVERLKWEAANNERQAGAVKQAGMIGALSTALQGVGGAISAGMSGTSLVSGAFQSKPLPVAPAVATMPAATTSLAPKMPTIKLDAAGRILGGTGSI